MAKPPTSSNKIRIESDGTSHGTRITNAFGQEIKNVKSFRIEAEASGLVKVDLELFVVPVDVEGRVSTVTLRCTECGFADDHDCRTGL